MKQNYLIKTLMLLVALVGGVSFSWADNKIPQNLGDHIVLGDNNSNFASLVTTHTGCTLDARLKKSDTEYVTVGTSNSGATLTLNVTATTAGNYVFGFKTGSDNGTSTVAITMLKSGESTPKSIATSEVVTQDGNWDPNVVHNFYIEALEAENYTITLTITNTGGGYSGNFGLFYFHTVSQYAMPLAGSINDESTHINLSDGTFKNCKYNSDKVVSDLDNGGYMDDVLLYNTASGYYKLLLNIKDYKAEGTLKATIFDFESGNKETEQTIDITSSGDKEITWPVAISPGLKRLRFDFTGTKTNGTIFNYRQVRTTITKYSLNEDWNYSPIAATNVDVELIRTLPADKWATIVLPFALTSSQITSAFGTNVKVAQLTGFSNDIMQFTSVTETNANEPYLIKRKDGEYNSGTATFNGVTIVEGTPQKTSISGIDFIGSYDALTNIPYSDESYAYYFISSNTFYQTEVSGTPDTMKGTRAYFKVPGTTAARSLSFSVDGGETTSIVNLNVNDNANFDNNAPIFNLAGQRVGRNYKGIVIVNGKKMINK